ncbi:MAG: glutamate--tRNA ligase family protein [Acidobacteriota bacterium]
MASVPPVRASEYRGRLAPSPTGYLHVGHARTFFKAYQRARDAGGALVMRMEDLDRERSRAEYADAAYEDLRWLGIRWQEGPDKGGPFAPYEQSRRIDLYVDVWRKLLRGGFLFPCSCSRKDLAAAAGAPHESGGKNEPLDDEPIYPGTCRGKTGPAPQLPGPTAGELEYPQGINWRFRVPDGEAIEFTDGNLGVQRFIAGRDFGDFLVWRRDGTPSYQLACVADDAHMQITEVVRGADLLKSTARQLLLYRALGIEAPKWFHCRLVLDQHGRRLAKRYDSLSIRTLRQRGLTPLKILAADVPLA